MILTSATSVGTESSRYNIKYPVNFLLTREGTEDSKINIKCHIFYKVEKPLQISGTEFGKQATELKELTRVVESALIDSILNGKYSGVLISTSSYFNANVIGRNFYIYSVAG